MACMIWTIVFSCFQSNMYSEMYSSRKSQCLVQLLSSYSVQFAKKASYSKILLGITVIVAEVRNRCGEAEISNQYNLYGSCIPKQGGCSLPHKSRLPWRFQQGSHFVDFWRSDFTVCFFFRPTHVLDENSRIKLISQEYNLETNFPFYNLQLEFMGFEVRSIFTVAYFQF